MHCLHSSDLSAHKMANSLQVILGVSLKMWNVAWGSFIKLTSYVNQSKSRVNCVRKTQPHQWFSESRCFSLFKESSSTVASMRLVLKEIECLHHKTWSVIKTFNVFSPVSWDLELWSCNQATEKSVERSSPATKVISVSCPQLTLSRSKRRWYVDLYLLVSRDAHTGLV